MSKLSLGFIKYSKVYARRDGQLVVEFTVNTRSFDWFKISLQVWLDCVKSRWVWGDFWVIDTPIFWFQYLFTVIRGSTGDKRK